MSDQADLLRALVRRNEVVSTGVEASASCRSLHVVGAKGGVGASNLVLNLACELARAGRRIVVSDTNPHNQDIRELGGPALRGIPSLEVVPALGTTTFEQPPELVLVDAGHIGARPLSPDLASGHCELVIVTTPEPVAIASLLRGANRIAESAQSPIRMRLVVSQAVSVFEARECMEDFGSRFGIESLGYVRTDDFVRQAVRSKRPLVLDHRHSPASRCYQRIARRLEAEICSPSGRKGNLRLETSAISREGLG